MAVHSYLGDVNAPAFPAGLDWLNTARPVTMAELRGKIVVLDFWTSGCINCMHMFPQLRKLKREFPNEIAVIGVHTGKFTAERETETIRRAILRFGIEYPVVNDRDRRVWQSFVVRAWPTLVFVDPRGKVSGQRAGELPYDALQRLAGEMITEFDSLGILNHNPLSFERESSPTGVLAFPSKLLVDGERLFVADTANHRIVVAGLDGTIQRTIGGAAGFQDGGFDEARFDQPRGLALAGDILRVADTENHAIRRIDLAAGTVSTIAGTGKQAPGYPVGGPVADTDLSSPWDVTMADGKLYIAMAGCHQIWALEDGFVYPYAGAGPEGIQDGPLQSAYLAQPSGITTDGISLIFADSETSAVRRADPDPGGEVGTYVGTGLFEYGDVDGIGPAVRLQHPIGVHYCDGYVYIADSFNNKIKRLDPATLEVVTVAGTGRAGNLDGPALAAELNEPEGLWAADGLLYIADTNNHAIRVLELASGRLSTLEMTGP